MRLEMLARLFKRLAFGFSILLCLSAAGAPEGPQRPPLTPDLPRDFQPDKSQAANLGPAVNSEFSDFGPVISPDGNYLYFTSDRPGGLGGQDIWVSRRVNGQWRKAENLGPPINTPGNEGPDCFSISEDALYFTACDREDSRGGCDIYVSFRLRDGSWSLPENLGPPVNTKYNESNASVSSDGEVLIFTSDRPGGLGGADLWMARRGKMLRKLWPGFSTAGRWEEPVNLGPNVNTPDWDGVGFIMPDNETLYFSSRGRGARGADIFRSVWQGSGWGPAENMGELINTARDDIYFVLPGSGDLAYFSSDMPGGLGMEDIYSIPIPLLVPKGRLVMLRGKILEESTGKPLPAKVAVIDPATSRVVAEVRSREDSGAFQVLVQIPRLQLKVECEGHEPYEERVDINEDKTLSVLTREITLSRR